MKNFVVVFIVIFVLLLLFLFWNSKSNENYKNGFESNLSNTNVTVGGYQNDASGNFSTVVAGANNRATGSFSTIVSGRRNNVSGNGSIAVGGEYNNVSGTNSVGLGSYNNISGNNSVAIGQTNIVNHDGCFAVGNGNETTQDNEFQMIFSNGGTILTSDSKTSGVKLLNGENSWSSICDRNLKNIQGKTNTKDLTNKLLSLQIYDYTLKSNGKKSVGPVSQEFSEVFGLSSDSKTINMMDALGICLGSLKDAHERINQLENYLYAR